MFYISNIYVFLILSKQILFIGLEESLLIIITLLLIFGPKKIPLVARDLGKAIRYIQKIIKEIKKEL